MHPDQIALFEREVHALRCEIQHLRAQMTRECPDRLRSIEGIVTDYRSELHDKGNRVNAVLLGSDGTSWAVAATSTAPQTNHWHYTLAAHRLDQP